MPRSPWRSAPHAIGCAATPQLWRRHPRWRPDASAAGILVEHDPFRKPVSTFRDHALWLADEELVHLGEGRRRLRLERVPAIEVKHRRAFRESRRELLLGRRIQYEAGELQAVIRQERFDLRQRHLMFLDVKDQVATFVGGEEIAERARRLQ